jgi:hypothetical protein
MSNKQTAVEWLYDTIIIFPESIEDLAHNARSFKQAKQMEAMQLESCAIHFTDYATECLVIHKQMDGEKHFEQYYFNNYGKW